MIHDLREARAPRGPDELAAFETDVLAGLVLARAAAGLADSTIAGEVIHLEQVRAWLGRALWTMQPADADAYFGQVLRGAARGTRLARAQALKTYFLFLELRHRPDIHAATGFVVESPLDEVNRPRGGTSSRLRIPPSEREIERLFTGWRTDARGPQVRPGRPELHRDAAGQPDRPRVSELCLLTTSDVRWDLGRFGKVLPHGKGSRGRVRRTGWCR